MVFTVKKDEETGELYIDFEDLKMLFDDPDSIAFYTMEHLEDGSIAMEFFDEYENKLPFKKHIYNA